MINGAVFEVYKILKAWILRGCVSGSSWNFKHEESFTSAKRYMKGKCFAKMW